MRTPALRTSLWLMVPPILATAAVAQMPAQTTSLPATGADISRVKAQCTACHGLDYVTRQPRGRGAAWWTTTIDDMVDTHGADIAEEDRKAIAAFLTRVNS